MNESTEFDIPLEERYILDIKEESYNKLLLELRRVDMIREEQRGVLIISLGIIIFLVLLVICLIVLLFIK